jgi:hypothetical protein
MLGVLWRLSRGYRLKPWRSPYLRWRIETYWGLQADQINAAMFGRFVWQHRAELVRYLRWAAAQHRASGQGELRNEQGRPRDALGC